jgi:alpha-amylase
MPESFVTLLLGVHAHQPVGNFPAVIDDAVERCYRPFLRTMLRYPEFRFSAHFSGWLLGELQRRYPEDVDMLAQMVRRGQVELFGAGDCEPVLAAIPARDRRTQLDAMSDRLEHAFGQRPHGAWLTERVWEATVVPALLGSGIRYVVVDDYHFLCTGRELGELDSYWSTEEDGQRLDVFPISEALRYRLPFSPADEVVAYLESIAQGGGRGAIYFDDIEKFGIWPETYEWVYRKGWLERFVEGVLASPRIRTATYAQFREQQPGRGVVYLPTTSYIEMNEWTLPARAAEAFDELVERERAAGRYDASKAFVRGGIWRNFFSRYPEANWMHKRMLALSGRLARAQVPDGRLAELRELLHRAQANDAYWHGLFGGLYLPHLRRSVWQHLLALERELEALSPSTSLERVDLDLDGRDEWLLRAGHCVAALRDDGHGAVHEFSSLVLACNFADTLARRREAYHRRIEERAQSEAAEKGIASAHDRVDFKHSIDAADLEEDERPRALLLDALWLPAAAEPLALDGYRQIDPDDPATAVRGVPAAAAVVFETRVAGGKVRKRIVLDAAGLHAEWRCTGLRGSRLVTQLNVSMPSCDGFSGRYILADGAIPCGFGQRLSLDAVGELALDDRELDGALALQCAPVARVVARPYQTVSLSEGGFEKVMQAASVDLQFDVASDDATIRLTLAPRR